MKVVIDTSVWISALITKESQARAILRMSFQKKLIPQIGEALFLEYESVMKREKVLQRSPLSTEEQEKLFNAYLSVCRWNDIYYLWRPNLKDVNDNFLIELCVASGSHILLTYNTKDFAGMELAFDIRVLTPETFLKEFV